MKFRPVVYLIVLCFLVAGTTALFSMEQKNQLSEIRSPELPHTLYLESSYPSIVRTQDVPGPVDELDDVVFALEGFDLGLPLGWTVEDLGDNLGDSWYAESFPFGDLTPPYMYVYSDPFGLLDERLITPSFSTEGYNVITLSFDNLHVNAGLGDYAAVDVSTDGGSTWDNAVTYTADIEEYPTYLDISAWAADEADVQVRFQYYDNNVWGWYWIVDNVAVEAIADGEAIPPEVTLLSYPEVNYNSNDATVVATATDDSGIASFDLTYGRYSGDTVIDQATVAMTPTGNPDEYSAVIPGGYQNPGDQIAWHLLAIDGSFNANERRLPAEADSWYSYYVHDPSEDIPWDTHHYYWRDATGGTELELDNDSNVEVVLADYGFGDFNWHGVAYDRIRVCTNGWITFSGYEGTDLYLPAFPDANEPNDVVALFATDLRTWEDESRVFVDVIDGKMIIQWDNMRFYTHAYGPTGQIVLDPFQEDPVDGPQHRVYLNYMESEPEWEQFLTIGYENEYGDLGNTILLTEDWGNLVPETSYRLGAPGLVPLVSGTVTDPDATPIEGALVELYTTVPVMVQAGGTTDAAGAYSFDDLAYNDTYSYEITASYLGYETVSYTGIDLLVDTIFDFVLNPIPPDPYDLLSPGNGTTLLVADVTLEWEATSDPDPEDPINYTVYLATDELFTENLNIFDAGDATTYDIVGLEDGVTYWWKVLAEDTHTEGTWSNQVWTFSVDIPVYPSVTLTPFDTPIEIPAEGGEFRYGVAVNNPLDETYYYDAWTMVLFPDGTLHGPAVYIPGLDVPANYTISVAPYQNVPAPIEPGIYTYIANIGTYPDIIDDTDSFTLEKLPGEELDTAPTEIGLEGWTYGGWDELRIDPEVSSLALPSDFGIKSIYPNPFNPATTVTISMPEAARLKVNVYNVIGQQVAVLANERYSAGYNNLVFDASNLSSGIYFVHAQVAGKMNVMQKVVLVR